MELPAAGDIALAFVVGVLLVARKYIPLFTRPVAELDGLVGDVRVGQILDLDVTRPMNVAWGHLPV